MRRLRCSHRAGVALAAGSASGAAAGISGAILTVTKVTSSTAVAVGDSFTYTITVQNVGDGAAVGVVLVDELPANVSGTSQRASQGMVCGLHDGGSRLLCSAATLAPGSQTVTVTVQANTPGEITNTVRVGREFSDSGHPATSGITTITPSTPTCNGLEATIVASAGQTFLNGTNGNDVIATTQGPIEIHAKKGNDTICTGDGNDRVFGDDGNDWIDAGNGKNYVKGGDQNDTITAGSGDDQVKAGSGTDTVNAGDGRNKVEGEAGNDSLTTGAGNDEVNGGSGTDSCAPGG